MKSITLDYSQMSAFLKCKRRGYYRHVCNLTPDAPATPLTFGSAIHEALAVWYKEGDAALTLKKFQEIWREQLQTPAEDDGDGFSLSPQVEDPKRNELRGLSILTEYMKQYPRESFEVISNEFPFKIPLEKSATREYYLAGKIDLFVRWNEQEYVMDHKTTSMLGAKYFDQFKLSLQLTGYALAAYTLFGSCDGAMVNAIFVGKSYKFARDIFAKTSEDFEEYKVNVLNIMEEIQRAKDTQIYPMNTDACMLYGSCPYREICEARGDERVIRNRYKVEEWNPLL